MWFQVHYPPLEGVLPIFRSRFWFAIGRQRVIASLCGMVTPIQFQTGFHVSGPTLEVPNALVSPVAYGTLSALYGRTFAERFPASQYFQVLVSGPTTPPGRGPVV